MLEIAPYLAKIRKEKGYSQQKMADFLQIPQRTWANYESGRSDPSLNFLIKLTEAGYKIPGLTAESENSSWANMSSKKGNLSEEIITPDSFQTASLQQDVKNDGFIIPVLDQSLSAGKGQLLPDDDVPIGYIAVPKELKRYGNKLAAIYVNGDSMEPTLQRGDLVVCDSCGWDGDGIYALRVDGCGYVKRLARKPGKLVVISDNPKYETWEEPTESEAVSIIGRVHYTLKHVD